MKKLLIIMLSLVALFLVWGCAPAGEPASVDDLSAEDLAALPADLQPMKSGALAGQAIYEGCVDPDAVSTFDRAQLITRSTTTFEGGSRADRCYTWYVGTPREKTRLIEGVCRNGRFQYWYATCSSGTRCQDGACVIPCTPSTEVCDGADNSCDGAIDEGGVCNTIENCGTFSNACATGSSCQGGTCLPTSTACSDSDSTDPDYLNPSLVTPGEVTTTYGTFSDFCDSTGSVLTEYSCAGAEKRESVFSCASLGYGYSCIDPDGAGSSPAYCGVSNCRVPCVPSSEICDGIDNDCDGTADEAEACNTIINCGRLGTVCATGQTCQDGVCISNLPAGSSSRCSRTEECASGLRCLLREGHYICTTPLSDGLPCISDVECIFNVCGRGENGASICESPGQSDGSVCDNYENRRVDNIHECASGICGIAPSGRGFICVSPKADGLICRDDTECITGICGITEAGLVCESPNQPPGSKCRSDNGNRECASGACRYDGTYFRCQ